eukprot:364510_1
MSWVHNVVEVKDLQIADHIYRHLAATPWFDAAWWQHHGIVTKIPEQHPNEDNIKVLEMTKRDVFNGVEEVSLRQFLDGRKLRRVKYNVSIWYEMSHVAGTCHHEKKSDAVTILKRCHKIKRLFNHIKGTYSLTGLNCEHFALFCATGIIHSSITITQLHALLKGIEESLHSCHRVVVTEVRHYKVNHPKKIHSFHHGKHSKIDPNNCVKKYSNKTHNSHHPITHHGSHHMQHSQITQKTAAKVSAKVTAKVSAKVIAKSAATAVSKVAASNATAIASTAVDTTTVTVVDTSKHILKSIAPCTLGCFIGIAAGIEVVFTGYRIYKYCTDINYLKEDLKWALIKGWTGTVCVIGVGIIGMLFGFGWWVLIPLLGVSIVIALLFKWLHKEKSYKEKVFLERGLKLDSSVDDKKKQVRKIKTEIVMEKLHPDKWTDIWEKYKVNLKLTERPFTISICSDEEGQNAIVDKVPMYLRWKKSIKPGMYVYSINCNKVFNEVMFEEIKNMWSELKCPMKVSFVNMKKVDNEKKKRMEKYLWLMTVKELLQEDIDEDFGECVNTTSSSKPLAITF